jgi:hypothetical protein
MDKKAVVAGLRPHWMMARTGAITWSRKDGGMPPSPRRLPFRTFLHLEKDQWPCKRHVMFRAVM